MIGSPFETASMPVVGAAAEREGPQQEQQEPAPPNVAKPSRKPLVTAPATAGSSGARTASRPRSQRVGDQEEQEDRRQREHRFAHPAQVQRGQPAISASSTGSLETCHENGRKLKRASPAAAIEIAIVST